MLTHEIINYNEHLPIRLFIQRIGSIEKHWHHSMELLLVLSGEVTVTVEEDSYQLGENDIILINPNQIHETSSKDAVLAVLQVRLSMYSLAGISQNSSFICNSVSSNDKTHFHNIRAIMAKLILLDADSQEQRESDLLIVAYAYMLMYE